MRYDVIGCCFELRLFEFAYVMHISTLMIHVLQACVIFGKTHHPDETLSRVGISL